jgi:hypothetical protein
MFDSLANEMEEHTASAMFQSIAQFLRRAAGHKKQALNNRRIKEIHVKVTS